ncbi:MAG: trigger factor [Propionibacteriaceae bacterium]|nr:trigger factor [Propionibacteriaceae bacterium]
MPSTVEQLSPTRAKVTITVPFADLAPAIDKAYKDIARNVNLPGFRRGHIPASLIDQRFGRGAVLQEAINAQLPDLYNQAVADNKLHPMGQPEIDIAKLEDGEVVELTAEVDVRPEFQLPDIDGIAVRVDPSVVSDQAVNERLDLLRQRFATFTDLDRAAAKDDVVIIDIAASQDGVDLVDADAKGVSYVVGAGGLIDGLDEAVTGLTAGQSKTFETQLVGGPQMGEQADVTVHVSKVQQRVLPPVNDEFAQMVSEYDTVDEMMGGLREGLERIERAGQLNAARDKVLDAVIEQCDFELPQAVLDDEVSSHRQDIEQQLARAGLSVERYLAESTEETATTPDEFWDGIAARSERALRARIVLDKVAEDEEVDVTQEDLSEFIVSKAMEDGMTPDQEAQHMMEHDHLAEWVGEIRRGKAVDLLVGRAVVKDTDGRKLDLSLVRSDGTVAAPQAAASSVTSEPTKAKGSKKKA